MIRLSLVICLHWGDAACPWPSSASPPPLCTSRSPASPPLLQERCQRPVSPYRSEPAPGRNRSELALSGSPARETRNLKKPSVMGGSWDKNAQMVSLGRYVGRHPIATGFLGFHLNGARSWISFICKYCLYFLAFDQIYGEKEIPLLLVNCHALYVDYKDDTIRGLINIFSITNCSAPSYFKTFWGLVPTCIFEDKRQSHCCSLRQQLLCLHCDARQDIYITNNFFWFSVISAPMSRQSLIL